MQDRLEQLLQAVAGTSKVLILPHNDPDPDAIASACALQHLLAETVAIAAPIAYRGLIGRAENKALVRFLGSPLRHLAASDLALPRPILLVDTQPGAGNNALPPGIVATAVFDHHPQREATAAAAFADIRPEIGATSTILARYLQAAHLEPPQWLATALFYGIKTDTLGLVRGASPADVETYFSLQPRIDVKALAEIERAQVPRAYFQQLDAALHAARSQGDVVLSFVGPMQRPDLAAEMADLLLRLQGINWAICMGVYGDELILNVRSRQPQGDAGQLVQLIVGDRGVAGGHGTMAAGHVPLQGENAEQLAQQLGQRALKNLNQAETAHTPLLAACRRDRNPGYLLKNLG